MKYSKKPQNVLFVEEESYNWAPVKTGNRRLIYLSILFVFAALLFSALR